MRPEYIADPRTFDRRRFLLKAGLLAAGSALGCSMAGCASEFEVYIPCLGPAAPPTPQPGMTYIRASEIGCALDCDLGSGRNKYTGGSATDDGPRINAAMAGASANNPITLIIDGSAMISGLFLPAGGYWSIAGLGCGTGFFTKSGSNNDAIHNGPPNAAIPFDPGPPAPPRGTNVSLSNFTINGNQPRDSTSGSSQGITGVVWYCGINLMNLNNITIENVVVVNTPTYHIRLSNVGNVSVSGCIMRGAGANTDGLHFDGPANDITITNCQFAIPADDSIALNCPEGHGGNIERVTVTGCTFNSWSLMRLYTTNGGSLKFSIDGVSVSNCSGTLQEAAFMIGLFSGSLPNSVASLTVSNCQLTAPAVLAVAENFGTIVLSDIQYVPARTDIVWAPPANKTCGFLRPPPLYGNLQFVGTSLSFQNCTISRNQNIDASAVILENQSIIDSIEFEGFSVQDAESYSPISDLLNLEGGSAGQLVIESLTSSNIKAPVESGGFSNVGVVSGAGVLATGWEFPNAVMANGVPYISATTGQPSIKIEGVVEPYS